MTRITTKGENETQWRKATVTNESITEAQALSAIWKEKAKLSQAEFGETFDIGNQSAVGQFLRGRTPLSLKAAAGFAKGLDCKIIDFSPRLADLAESYSALSGLESRLDDLTKLSREELQHILLLRNLSADGRSLILSQAVVLSKQERQKTIDQA